MSWRLESPVAVDEMVRAAARLGYNIPMQPRDEPWGVREFRLRHPQVLFGATHHLWKCVERPSHTSKGDPAARQWGALRACVIL
jgi:hypothetical protein